MLSGERDGSSERRRAYMATKRDLNSGEAVDLKNATKRIFAKPACVLRMYLPVTAPAVDEATDVEHIWCREHEPPTRCEVPSYTCEKSVHVVEMLDDLSGEHGVKCPLEIEVLGVSHVGRVSL